MAERAADAIGYFDSAGFRVHGDLDDLVSPPSAGPARRPDDVSETELLAVTQEALAAVLLEMTRRQGLEPYDGPRSRDEPLPTPEELGLTGEPPEPGARLAARIRRAAAGDPPAIVKRRLAKKAAKKAAKKQARRAQQRAAKTGSGSGRKAAEEGCSGHDPTAGGQEGRDPTGVSTCPTAHRLRHPCRPWVSPAPPTGGGLAARARRSGRPGRSTARH